MIITFGTISCKKEVTFRQTKFEAVREMEIVYCKNHTVCTISVANRGSICNMDEGGPLYKLTTGGSRQVPDLIS